MPPPLKGETKRQRTSTGLRKPASIAYHHGDLRQALKEAALEQLGSPNALRLSFRDLARRLGVTTGAPYHHFKDRTALLVELATDGFNQLSAALQQAADERQSNTAIVQALTCAYLEFAHKQRGYYQAMLLPEVCAEEAPELRQAADACFQLVCSTIAQVYKTLPSGEVPDRAVTLWSLLHGMISLKTVGTLERRLPLGKENELAVQAVLRLLDSNT